VLPSGIDHCFVVIGNMQKDKIGDLVAVDAWATSADPCLFEDHFCFSKGKRNMPLHREDVAKGGNKTVAQIIAGLSLTPAGKASQNLRLNKETTEKRIKEMQGLWDREEASNVEYDYVQ